VKIHFHVFEKIDLLALLAASSVHPKARLRYEIVDACNFFPPDAGNGFLVSFGSNKA
jgi:hypothetical protein